MSPGIFTYKIGHKKDQHFCMRKDKIIKVFTSASPTKCMDHVEAQNKNIFEEPKEIK